MDTNGNVLVDNIGVKTIYYNKIKGINIEDEIEIAKKLADILTIDAAGTKALKDYWLVTNSNGKSLITEEEYKLLEERKLTNNDITDLKYERITEEMLNSFSDIEKKQPTYIV